MKSPLKPYRSTTKESGGVALLSILMTIVLLIGIYACLQILNLSDTEKASLHICRSELLKHQNDAGKKLNSLMNLNSTVLSLRTVKASARAMIATGTLSLNPILVASGTKLLSSTLKTEKIIENLQKYNLASADLKMFLGLHQTKEKINQELKTRAGLQTQWNAKSELRTELNRIFVYGQHQHPAVEAEHYSDGPPTYQFKKNFIHKQTLHISWRYQHLIGYEVHKNQNELWKQMKISKQQTCAVSLKEIAGKLEPVLVQDKPLLKPF